MTIMNKTIKSAAAITLTAFLIGILAVSYGTGIQAAENDEQTEATTSVPFGGGYAVTGQLKGVGYTAKLYDATNGLPTSDANYVMGSSDGYIWIGGYSGIIRYDGSSFERLDASGGLTSGRVIYEDSKGRIWVGTNDNGVVMIDGSQQRKFSYDDGLPSSSVRAICEDDHGNIFIGHTSGLSYIDDRLVLHNISDPRLDNQIITRLSPDRSGTIYGSTKEGDIFSIDDIEIKAVYSSDSISIGMVSTIYADPDDSGMVYIGAEDSYVYYGLFGQKVGNMKKISVAPVDVVYWITEECGRVWVTSEKRAGYIDENDKFQVIENTPMDDSIDMITTDYQGNLWAASSRQGVMKIVADNFEDVSYKAGLAAEVVNATYMHNNLLYVATDVGLFIIDNNYRQITNELTKMLSGSRIRCVSGDNEGGIWISTFTNDHGLVHLLQNGKIVQHNTDNGMPSNAIRCTVTTDDGSVLVGTNSGLAVIKDDKIINKVGEAEGMDNTVILTVCEGDNGTVYAGSDGGGIYVISGSEVTNIGREKGLTSDVILRIKKDEKNGVYWIVTSNSIEYMKDGVITNVTSFPYNNNFDLYFDQNDHIWVLSSYGVFSVQAEDMLNDEVNDYRLYTIEDGLTSIPTANAYSMLQDNGDLYISGRSGVCKVNINHYFEEAATIKVAVRSVFCDDEEIIPDEEGVYRLPSSQGRITITPSILDYSMTNPLVRVYLEGDTEGGSTSQQKDLKPLEYTGLRYGNYDMHIQILNQSTGEIIQDKVFKLIKKPSFFELFVVRIIFVLLLALATGFIVWRTMTGTVIRRQYDEIQKAKDEAERANTAKTRFLANMSHEIRTPINTIMGMDEMIIREDTSNVPKAYSTAITNYATDIKNASESLLGLINDLLDMSKIESGKMHLVEQEYDTADLLRSIVSMIRIRSAQKDLTFGVDIDPELPGRLYGDAGKIKQIVLNLLTNAVKYTDSGGFTLSVRVDDKNDERCSLTFSVKDTGIGVKPEDMEKLFMAYERLDEEKNSGIQGTGLGLDISKRFAELMDGSLTCESTYGEGSEFILTIDQRVIDVKGIGEFKEHEEESSGPYVPQFVAPDAEVLVVDDNPMNLTVIKGLLKATRIFVTTASSGEECLDKLRYGTYNVVLLDHMMPGMDGLETIAEIRKTKPDLPVYALTANAVAGGDDFYISKGFNGYLSKPIDSKTLELAIMKHLPEEILMRPGIEDIINESNELPDDMTWLNDVEGISTNDGIKNSGGVTMFLHSLNDFYDTIEHTAKVIEDAYDNGDIKLYTVKVHALKTSARIVGANRLSVMAERIEEACKNEEMDFVIENKDDLMTDFRDFKEKLKDLKAKDGSAEDNRPEIPADELNDAYAALKEVVPQMDYDSVEMIVDQLKEYKLPDGDSDRMERIEKCLKLFEWDEMEKILMEL